MIAWLLEGEVAPGDTIQFEWIVQVDPAYQGVLVNWLRITTEAELEDRLSEPTAEVIETLGRLSGDIVVLGVAGKMGPTLARMARRASDAAGVPRRVIGVARYDTSAAVDCTTYIIIPRRAWPLGV